MGATDEVIVWETGQQNGEQCGVAVANATVKAECSIDTKNDAELSGERVVWTESEAVKEMVSALESAAAGEQGVEKGKVAELTRETSVENLGDASGTASGTVSGTASDTAMARRSLEILGEVTGGVTAEERAATEKSVGMTAVAPRHPGWQLLDRPQG